MLKIKFTLVLLLLLKVGAFAQKLTEAEKYVFDDIAYHRRQAGEYAVISKWVIPIKYKVYGEVDNKLMKEIDSTFSHLQRLTQLDIAKTDNDAEANFIFVFGQSEVQVLSKNMLKYLNTYGGTQYRTNKNFEITRVENVVNPDKYRFKQDAKLAVRKHIVKSMGFFKTTDLAPSSLFFVKNNGKNKIDAFDSHIITTLYRVDIKPGMTKEEVDQLLERVN